MATILFEFVELFLGNNCNGWIGNIAIQSGGVYKYNGKRQTI
jgi:hypothetical protein